MLPLVALLALAGSTPPVTTHSLSGTAGQAGWFRSDIDVTLTVTDTESGPARTTYWVNSDPPTVINHGGITVDPFDNNSFEQGSFFNISNWYAGSEGAGGSALFYRSSVSPQDGNRSAAIAAAAHPTFYYWHNEPDPVEYLAGEEFTITAWTRLIYAGTSEAYFEVWGQDLNGEKDQLIATSSTVSASEWAWKQVSATFTVPAINNHIYLKLGAEIDGAMFVYWDLVEVDLDVNPTAEVDFTFMEEGSHVLHYFSEDHAGNTELEKTTDLKKDTVVPNPWQSFASSRTTCNHCHETSAQVRDVTSGVDVSTAEYRFYTDHQSQFWSGWLAVDTVTLASGGGPAADGETDFVELTTPSIDFGDSSSGPFRVQFRIADLAGNLSTSPVYEIAAPWLQALDGSIYIGGEISVATPGSGDPHATADVLAGDEIVSFVTSTNWKDGGYLHANFGEVTLTGVFSEYTQIKAGATTITDGRLPRSDGVYLIEGNFEIDASAMHGGGTKFEDADMSAVVLVTGNLSITNGFTVVEENNTVFLVEGDLTVDKNVKDMAGFYVTTGTFNSDPTGDSTKPLRVDGSVVSLGGFELPRDLGDQGSENNSNTPAEQFTWQPDLAVDQTLAGYLTNQPTQYSWQEVVGP